MRRRRALLSLLARLRLAREWRVAGAAVFCQTLVCGIYVVESWVHTRRCEDFLLNFFQTLLLRFLEFREDFGNRCGEEVQCYRLLSHELWESFFLSSVHIALEAWFYDFFQNLYFVNVFFSVN